MTDIVERLRNRKAFLLNGGIWIMSAEPDPVCREAADEIERLRERLGPRGLEVVEIDGAGHYVNVKVKAEIERLRKGTGADQAVEELLDALKEAVAMLEIYYEPNIDGSTPTITRCRSIIAKYSAHTIAAAQP